MFSNTVRPSPPRTLLRSLYKATAARTNPTWKGRQLLPYANRIGGATYTFNGTKYKLPVNDVAGLNNSLHGLLWNKELDVIDTEATQTSASVLLGYSFNGSESGYPFSLTVKIRYTLSSDGFFATVDATNEDVDGWPLPFFNGWHPYFLATLATATLTLDPCSAGWNHVDVHVGPQYPPPRYSNMVPTTHVAPWSRFDGSLPFGGNASLPTYFDDEVKSMGESNCSSSGFKHVLHDADSGIYTTLHVSREFKFLQIFTGAKSIWGVDAVVLEPLSAMSDSYNNHDNLHIISAGQ